MSKNPDLTLYNLEQVSEILGITHRTAWSYVKQGKLKAVMIGNAWKVTEENLKKFINGDV